MLTLVSCLCLYSVYNNFEPGLVRIVLSYIGLPCDNCQFGIVLWSSYLALDVLTVSDAEIYNMIRDSTNAIDCGILCDDCMDTRCHTGDIHFCTGCYRDTCSGCGHGCDCGW